MAEREVKAWALILDGEVIGQEGGEVFRSRAQAARHAAFNGDGEVPVRCTITYDDGKDEGGRADG